MKSVTIKDKNGTIIFKVIQHKNGKYEMIREKNLCNISVEVRDERNMLVYFGKDENVNLNRKTPLCVRFDKIKRCTCLFNKHKKYVLCNGKKKYCAEYMPQI